MEHQTNPFFAVPAWMNALAIHEAERIYEMMPRMIGEKAHVVPRLAEGIIKLLSCELQKQAA
jgi:hypothetical protein